MNNAERRRLRGKEGSLERRRITTKKKGFQVSRLSRKLQAHYVFLAPAHSYVSLTER